MDDTNCLGVDALREVSRHIADTDLPAIRQQIVEVSRLMAGREPRAAEILIQIADALGDVAFFARVAGREDELSAVMEPIAAALMHSAHEVPQ